MAALRRGAEVLNSGGRSPSTTLTILRRSFGGGEVRNREMLLRIGLKHLVAASLRGAEVRNAEKGARDIDLAFGGGVPSGGAEDRNRHEEGGSYDNR